MTRRILVVEDEHDFSGILAMNLRKNGFEPIVARTGATALAEARRSKFDLVLLDLMLPDLSGKEVCRRLKADTATSSIPVIMVTAMGEEVDRVIGFELGADDFVVKPVSMRELILRINAVLRRGAGSPGETAPSVEIGALRIDGPAHRVFVEDQEISLSALEFRVLVALATSSGRVHTREHLLDAVWGLRSDIESRSVDTLMKRLRDKLGTAGDLIRTVRGVGYRFTADP